MGARNVTVSLEEQVALWARFEAARRDTCFSRLLGDLMKQHMASKKRYEKAMRSALARARFLKGEGRYPSQTTRVRLARGWRLETRRVGRGAGGAVPRGRLEAVYALSEVLTSSACQRHWRPRPISQIQQ